MHPYLRQNKIKWTVSVYFSNPEYKDGYVWLTTVSLKLISIQFDMGDILFYF